MKILGILASHDNSGITAQMLANVLRPANGKCDSETIYLDDYQIKPDLPGKNNPTLDLLEKKLSESDVWVLAVPTYWKDISGTMKNFFDCIRSRIVRFDHTGQMHPSIFQNKHYVSLTCCFTSSFENLFSGITDQTFKEIDLVMSAAGLIKVDELVTCGTFNMKKLPENKRQQCVKIGEKIVKKTRRDDQTLKRYFELFSVVAIMSLITMLIQRAIAVFWLDSGYNFWFNYISFVLIFFYLIGFDTPFFDFC